MVSATDRIAFRKSAAMSREFRSLLMKEWGERRSQFWIGIVYVVGLIGYCIAYEIEYRTRAVVASYYSSCLIFGQLAAILLAMSTATGEYSQRTLKFTASLPVSLRKVAWARLLGAWGCLATPILVGAVLMTVVLASGLVEQAGLRSDTVRLPDRPSLSRLEAIGFLWTTAAVAIASALQLSSVLSLLGTRCRTEGTVGFLGAIVVLFTMMFTTARTSLDAVGQFALSDWIGAVLPGSLLINWGYGELDGSSYIDLDPAPLMAGPLAVNLLITLAVAMAFVRLYGRRAEVAVQAAGRWRLWRPALPQFASRLGIRWPGRVAALAWLNARQSVPLSLAGLVIAALMTLISLNATPSEASLAARWAGELPSSTWMVGTLWAAIVAVGIFAAELKPDLEQFWRSRAISPNAWFWTKFLVGLFAVLGALDAIPALLALSSPHQPNSGRVGTAYLICIPFIHIQVYSLAVAAICQLRRAVPAAMTALLLFYVFDSVLQSIPYSVHLSTLDVFNRLAAAEKAGLPLNLREEGYLVVYGIIAVTIAGAIVLARRRLMLPRAMNAALVAALILSLSCGSTAMGDDESTVASEIVAGLRQREALLGNMRMRLSTRTHHSDAYVAFAAESAALGRRQRRAPLPTFPRDEESTYELFERPPCRAWSEFGPDGGLRSRMAFDGTAQRHFNIATRSSPQGTITMSAQPPLVPFLYPETSLLSCGGRPLKDLLVAEKLTSVQRRDVDGEHIIDFEIQWTEPAGVNQAHRCRVTVNASRNYWPVHMELDVIQGPDGHPLSRQTVDARGWIEAGTVSYPRHVEQNGYRTLPKVSGFTDTVAGEPDLQRVVTQKTEVLELVVDAELPDQVFASPFPPGMIIYDQSDRKFYQADDSGAVHRYQPIPKGTRGAVFAYHLAWISAAAIFLYRGTGRL
jgi:ABC-type transport system involved in multi-copper enzyme maturation permease subunit